MEVLKLRTKVRLIIGNNQGLYKDGDGNSYYGPNLRWPLQPSTDMWKAAMDFCKTHIEKYNLQSREQKYWIIHVSIKKIGNVKFSGYLAEMPLNMFLGWSITLSRLVLGGIGNSSFSFLFTDFAESKRFSSREFICDDIWKQVRECALDYEGSVEIE